MGPGRPVIFLLSLSCIKGKYQFPRTCSSVGCCLLILWHSNIGVPCTQDLITAQYDYILYCSQAAKDHKDLILLSGLCE